MGRPRKYPEGTTRAEVQRAYRDRLAAADASPVRIAVDRDTAEALDRLAEADESRGAVVARLARAAAGRTR